MNGNSLRRYDNICETFGQSPLIRLNRVPKQHGVMCQFFAKAEFLNAGGSSKDRIALRMVREAERKGLIRPGDTLVEATSGNTGIGLALVALTCGYRLKVVCGDKVSAEKINTLRNLGAEVTVVNSDLKREDPGSGHSISTALGTLPGHFLLDQYNNPANFMAHYETTAEELLQQMDGQIDYVFCGAGTCGTITGLGKRLHEVLPNVRVVGIDLIGSVLARPDPFNTPDKRHKIEGIGQTKVPSILDYGVVDGWIKVDDGETFLAARALIEQEGLLVGGSSGACLIGAIRYLKQQGLHTRTDLRCVIVLPDSTRNYMTKFFSDAWMVGNGFFPCERLLDPAHPLVAMTIADLPQARPSAYYDRRLTVRDCLELFAGGASLVPLRDRGEVEGVVTPESLTRAVVEQRLNSLSSCSHCLTRDFLKVSLSGFSINLIRCSDPATRDG